MVWVLSCFFFIIAKSGSYVTTIRFKNFTKFPICYPNVIEKVPVLLIRNLLLKQNFEPSNWPK